jgi:hypothetical protein
MARYLIVANLTGESPSLRDRVQEIANEDHGAEFVVLVPAYAVPQHLVLLAGLEDDAIKLGRHRAQRVRRRLEAVGANIAAVRLSHDDPLHAVEDELRAGDFEAVIVSTLPRPFSHWLKRDLPGQIAHRHPEVRVIHVIAPAALYEEEILGTAAAASSASET